MKMKKLLAILIALVTIAAIMAVPASAAVSGAAITAVNNTVTVTKNLELTNFNAQYTKIPGLVFDFVVSPYTQGAVDGVLVPGSANTYVVYAGVGSPVVSTATGSTHTIDYSNHTFNSASENRQSFTIDFSNVTFSRPGFYRYTLTETADTNAALGVDDAIKYDETRYFLDVYVVNDSSSTTGYKVTTAILYDSSSNSRIDTAGTYSDGTVKIDTITNKYDIYHLKLTKNVKGEAGDTNNEFSFTITLANGPKDFRTKAVVTKNGVNEEQDITFDSNGTSTVTVSLKHGDTFEAWSLPEGTTYTITETLNDHDSAIYSTQYSINNGTQQTATNATVPTQTITENNNVTFINNASTASPTGLFMSYGPYVLLVIAAAGLAVLFLRKRRNTAEEL